MKKLFLIRHAKSDWSNPSLEDFDRPLNKRGLKNAPFMGEILKEKEIFPDLIIASPAYRSRATAKIIAKKIKFRKENITYNEHLYEAKLSDILDIIKYIEDESDIVFIIGHNPSLNMLGFYLVDFNENLPTCGILEIDFDCESWRDINKKCAKLINYEYPKKYNIKN